MAKSHPFSIGDRVEDRQSRIGGTIVYLYANEDVNGEVVAVRFDDDEIPVGVDVRDIRHEQRLRWSRP